MYSVGLNKTSPISYTWMQCLSNCRLEARCGYLHDPWLLGLAVTIQPSDSTLLCFLSSLSKSDHMAEQFIMIASTREYSEMGKDFNDIDTTWFHSKALGLTRYNTDGGG